MPKPTYTLKPQVTPLPSQVAKEKRVGGVDTVAGAAGAGAASAGPSNATGTGGTNGTNPANEQPKYDPFIRAEAEDDDGYDPYSDRPPTPEPTFQEDPWR